MRVHGGGAGAAEGPLFFAGDERGGRYGFVVAGAAAPGGVVYVEPNARTPRWVAPSFATYLDARLDGSIRTPRVVVAVDPAALTRADDGEIVGPLALWHVGGDGAAAFPEADWVGPVVDLLPRWRAALAALAGDVAEAADGAFLDRGFAFRVTPAGPDGYHVVCLRRAFRARTVVAAWETPRAPFEASLRAAERAVRDEWVRRGWTPPDAEPGAPLRYAALPSRSPGAVEAAIADGDPEAISEAVLAATFEASDPASAACAADVCVRLARHPDPGVRGNALLGFGHLARGHAALDAAVVRPLLEAGLRDPHPFVRGHAASAMDDVSQSLGWTFTRPTDGSGPAA